MGGVAQARDYFGRSFWKIDSFGGTKLGSTSLRISSRVGSASTCFIVSVLSLGELVRIVGRRKKTSSWCLFSRERVPNKSPMNGMGPRRLVLLVSVFLRKPPSTMISPLLAVTYCVVWRVPMMYCLLPSTVTSPVTSLTSCTRLSCTEPSLPMKGVTVSVVPICCWVTVELVVALPAVLGVLVEPVTTGRVSPSKNLAWLPWLVTTEGTVRIVEVLLRGVVVSEMIPARSTLPAVRVMVAKSVVEPAVPLTPKPGPEPLKPTSLSPLT